MTAASLATVGNRSDLSSLRMKEELFDDEFVEEFKRLRAGAKKYNDKGSNDYANAKKVSGKGSGIVKLVLYNDDVNLKEYVGNVLVRMIPEIKPRDAYEIMQ